METDETTELIERLKNGEEKAFIQLVDLYDRRLFGYALTLTNDHALAQDILQNVFLRTWEKRKNLRIDVFPTELYVQVGLQRVYQPVQEKPLDHGLGTEIFRGVGQSGTITQRNILGEGHGPGYPGNRRFATKMSGSLPAKQKGGADQSGNLGISEGLDKDRGGTSDQRLSGSYEINWERSIERFCLFCSGVKSCGVRSERIKIECMAKRF